MGSTQGRVRGARTLEFPAKSGSLVPTSADSARVRLWTERLGRSPSSLSLSARGGFPAPVGDWNAKPLPRLGPVVDRRNVPARLLIVDPYCAGGDRACVTRRVDPGGDSTLCITVSAGRVTSERWVAPAAWASRPGANPDVKPPTTRNVYPYPYSVARAAQAPRRRLHRLAGTGYTGYAAHGLYCTGCTGSAAPATQRPLSAPHAATVTPPPSRLTHYALSNHSHCIVAAWC